MGWLTYPATCFKSNGEVDRKAQMDKTYLVGNHGMFKILKSTMIGSTYFAAVAVVKEKKKINGETVYIDVPESKQKVDLAIYLTSVNGDYFSEKSVDDYRCPQSIFKLCNMIPEANQKEYWEYQEEIKRMRQLGKFPLGAKIKAKIVTGEELILVRGLCRIRKNGKIGPHWLNETHTKYVNNRDILPDYVLL